LDKSLYRGADVGFTAEHAGAGKDRPNAEIFKIRLTSLNIQAIDLIFLCGLGALGG
jgi:hypothetical protein